MLDPAYNRDAPPAILEIRGLDKVYEASNGPVEALRSVDLNVRKSEFVCLLGASGCGKSTLLRIIAGFETATHGSVAVYGCAVDGPGPDRGMVFQDYALFPWLSVRDNIGFGPRHRRVPAQEIAKLTERFMAMVGLTAFADRYPHQLSGGMKQRVAIARVLANDSDILLMDEPFGALDALTRAALQEELIEIWRSTRMTVIFVTHSVEEAVLLADRVVVMSSSPGRIDCEAEIDLPRPRDVASADFNALRRSITRQLTSHVGGGRTMAATADS